jgi:predicted neuraminidase
LEHDFQVKAMNIKMFFLCLSFREFILFFLPRLLSAFIVLLLVLPNQSAWGEGHTFPILEQISQSVVFQPDKTDPYDLTNLYGFNHAPSVTMLADGRLMVAWFSGPYEASVHQVILSATSDDGGKSWSKTKVLNDLPRLSDFDPAFIKDGNTTHLFFSAGRWTRYPFIGISRDKTKVGPDSFKIYSRVTENSGKTWSSVKPIDDNTGWGCRSNGIKLSTGEFILPIHSFGPGHTAAVLYSTDKGKNWTRSTIVKLPGKTWAVEPSVVEIDNNNLMMILRSRDGFLWMTKSKNHGKNWEDPVKTKQSAAYASHNIISTKKGDLVLTHNPSTPPVRTPLTIRASNNQGATWGKPLVLSKVEVPKPDDEVFSRQVTYPSAVQLPDGNILVVWTEIEVSPSIQSGIIQSAIVKVNSK